MREDQLGLKAGAKKITTGKKAGAEVGKGAGKKRSKGRPKGRGRGRGRGCGKGGSEDSNGGGGDEQVQHVEKNAGDETKGKGKRKASTASNEESKDKEISQGKRSLENTCIVKREEQSSEGR